jgi:hypothetical protein
MAVASPSSGDLVALFQTRAVACYQLCGCWQAVDADGVSKLSDAELVQRLSDQAKQLGVEINLNYAFLQQQKPDDEPQG